MRVLLASTHDDDDVLCSNVTCGLIVSWMCVRSQAALRFLASRRSFSSLRRCFSSAASLSSVRALDDPL